MTDTGPLAEWERDLMAKEFEREQLPQPVSPSREAINAELAAMRGIVVKLDALDVASRERVLHWLFSAYIDSAEPF